MKNSKSVLYKFVACMTAAFVIAGGGIWAPVEIYAAGEGPEVEITKVEITEDELRAIWDFDIDGDKIILKYHAGSETEIIVPGKYIIDGDVFTVKLAQDSSNMFNTYKDLDDYEALVNPNNKGITSIKFDPSIDTSNVTNMSAMFRNCTALTTLDISCFNTSNVTNMARMFDGLQHLTELDLRNFNTDKVTTMAHMFQNNHNLRVLNLSSFNPGTVVAGDDPDGFKWMFEGCDYLGSVSLSDDWFGIPEDMVGTSQMLTGDPDHRGEGDEGDDEHTGCGRFVVGGTRWEGPDGRLWLRSDGASWVPGAPEDSPVTINDLTGFYDAAAGRWVRPEKLDGIRPYGQCKDHKDEILGVKVISVDEMELYWVEKNSGTLHPVHREKGGSTR